MSNPIDKKGPTMKTKLHTPGPWTVWKGHTSVHSGKITSNTPGGMTCEDTMEEVANCDAFFVGESQAQANAQLIAAAPDLLAILKELAETDISRTDDNLVKYIFIAIREKARKITAAAEGRGN